jgi:hypothetical protein
MAKFSAISKERLATCDDRIQRVMNEVIKYFDCMIMEGNRNEADQNRAYSQGRSKVKFPNGKHNTLPSRAVDAMPFPVDWKDTKRMCYFAGYVMAIALSMGIKLRWGYDWDGDKDLNDQTFYDGPHYELVD